MAMMLSIGTSSCNKEGLENKRTVEKIYKVYKNGGISQCFHNGQTVYLAYLNGTDFGSYIYDDEGYEIGRCDYAWGVPDSICSELTDCEEIYMVKDNIWGRPPINVYGLGRFF